MVDGTLIEAVASLKSFRRRDGDPPTMSDQDSGNPSVDFQGERRVNATHQSTTDPEALLFRKGKGKDAKPVFLAHARMENRNNLLAELPGDSRHVQGGPRLRARAAGPGPGAAIPSQDRGRG